MPFSFADTAANDDPPPAGGERMEELPSEVVACLREVLLAVRLRICFVGHPREPRFPDGGVDWSHELQVIEQALKRSKPPMLRGVVEPADAGGDDLHDMKLALNNHAIPALQAAYRKHVQLDESIGWVELSDLLMTALCECMGDPGFQAWVARTGEGLEKGDA